MAINPIQQPAAPRTIDRAVVGRRVALIVAGVNYPGPEHRSIKIPAKDLTYFERAKQAEEVRQPNDALVLKNYRYEVDGRLTLKPGPANVPERRRHQFYYMGVKELAEQLTRNPDGDVPIENTRPSVVGTVREVHFIGHAFEEGPIIVNTSQKRHPEKEYDKAGRPSDFGRAELFHLFDEKNLPRFRAAFTPDAVLTIWGCDDNPDAKELLARARAKAAAGKPIQTELAELKKRVTRTYAARLAQVCGRTVYCHCPAPTRCTRGRTTTIRPRSPSTRK